MASDHKIWHELYMRELNCARIREAERRKNPTFFHVGPSMRNDMHEEIEYSVRYSRWGMK